MYACRPEIELSGMSRIWKEKSVGDYCMNSSRAMSLTSWKRQHEPQLLLTTVIACLVEQIGALPFTPIHFYNQPLTLIGQSALYRSNPSHVG